MKTMIDSIVIHDGEREWAIPAEDIIEHFPTLTRLSKDCKHITELGVRYCVSTWAFLEGLKGELVSVDIVYPPAENLKAVKKFCEGKIKFTFILGDSLKIELAETDMLFIDTLHTNEQLTKELELHSDKARKYIVMHDTESSPQEMWPPIGRLLAKGVWKIKEHHDNNNGLTVLERI